MVPRRKLINQGDAKLTNTGGAAAPSTPVADLC